METSEWSPQYLDWVGSKTIAPPAPSFLFYATIRPPDIQKIDLCLANNENSIAGLYHPVTRYYCCLFCCCPIALPVCEKQLSGFKIQTSRKTSYLLFLIPECPNCKGFQLPQIKHHRHQQQPHRRFGPT